MGLSLADARVLEDKAREEVERKSVAHDTARQALVNARTALHDANESRADALKTIEELRTKLKATQLAIMPSENASRMARLELESAQKELAKSREERIAAEAMLVLMEKEKEQAERLLSGAQEDLEKSDEIESSSRESLDKKLQSASDAQQAMDDVLRAIDEARTEVEAARAELFKARAANTSLPRDEDSLSQAAKEKLKDVEEARKGVEAVQEELEALRNRQEEVDLHAQTARETYDKVQQDLHQAEAAKDRARSTLLIAERLPGLDDSERQQLEKAQADYDTAVAYCEEVQEQYKVALTAYADADVEVIRFKLANEETSKRLEEAKEHLAQAELAHQSLCDAAQKSASELRESSDEIERLEKHLKESEERLAQLESDGKAATQNNETEQRGLKEMQEIALRYGRQSRNAASILDGRRHKLSDIVSAIEVGATQLESLKRREEESAKRLDTAFSANQQAVDTLRESKGFILIAQQEIDAKTNEVLAAEKRIGALEDAVRSAEATLVAAKSSLEHAKTELTDAQVSVIMAEIG